MAVIKFTNPSSQNTVYVDVDPSDRIGRDTRWIFTPSEVKAIDEVDLMPALETYEGLQQALLGNMLTIVESDLDNLSTIEAKNFLAWGLGIKYYYSANTLLANKAVKYDTINGTINYVSTEGEKPIGITRTTAFSTDYVRIKISGLTSAIAGADIKLGDKLISKIDGNVTPSIESGKWQIGVALADTLAGNLVYFNIDIKQII